jgi:hypothetical protein
MPELIPVAKGGEYLEVHPSTLRDHKRCGWAECERRAPAEADDDNEPGAMKVADIRAALTAKGVEFDPKAKKPELLALLQAQPD